MMTVDMMSTEAWSSSVPELVEEPWDLSAYLRATSILAEYLTWILVAVGVPSNLLSFLTMMRRSMRGQSTSVYLASLALSDIACLVLISLVFVQEEEPSCHVTGMLLNSSLTCSGLLILLVTIERLIAVCVPLKVAIWMSKKRARVLVAAVVVLSYGMYIPRLIHASDDGSCDPSPTYEPFYFIQLTLFYSCGPIILLIIFNTGIVIRLQMRSSILLKAGQQGNYAEMRRVTVVVVSVALAYILLTLPSMLSLVYQKITGKPVFENPDLEVMITVLSYHLVMLNHAINFWLYVIMSTKFRRALKEMIICRRSETSSENSEISLKVKTVTSVAESSTVVQSVSMN